MVGRGRQEGRQIEVPDALWCPLLFTDLCYAITPGTFEDIVDHLVPELQRRGVHWLDYPSVTTNAADAAATARGLTAREGLYGVGQSKLREDHYGSRFKWRAGQARAPELDSAGGVAVVSNKRVNGENVGGEEAIKRQKIDRD